jgi:DUF2950 family protein
MITNIGVTAYQRTRSSVWRALSGALLLICALASAANAQRSFKTAEEAAQALADAARTGDRRSVLAVLGRDGVDIVTSGDEVADEAMRQRFLAAYEAKHQVAMEGENKAIMIVGQEDFPFPIPLVRDGEAWRFDTAAGRLEILYRRIGRNELAAIQACLAYVDAQNEYAAREQAAGAYAQRIVSQPGKKDGLYWQASGGDVSPLGEFMARATAEGYGTEKGRSPYHGYYYRILTRQGANVPGGAIDYVARGKMIGGFALVAYPAEYGNSGVMTFLINHAGTIYQKDLGPSTERMAERMTAFNPDQTWKKVDAAQAQ